MNKKNTKKKKLHKFHSDVHSCREHIVPHHMSQLSTWRSGAVFSPRGAYPSITMQGWIIMGNAITLAGWSDSFIGSLSASIILPVCGHSTMAGEEEILKMKDSCMISCLHPSVVAPNRYIKKVLIFLFFSIIINPLYLFSLCICMLKGQEVNIEGVLNPHTSNHPSGRTIPWAEVAPQLSHTPSHANVARIWEERGKCINVQIAFIKSLSYCQQAGCERFMLSCALPLPDWIWRSFGRFYAQTQIKLFVSFHIISKRVNSDKLPLGGVQRSWGPITKKNKEREKKNTGKISIVFYNITENKPGDETCSVFKALTYIFFSLLSPAQFTGFIFSLIKNSPSCSSQQFSQGCRITSEKFGEMNRPVKWLTLSAHLKISVQHTKLHKAGSGFRQWIFFLFAKQLQLLKQRLIFYLLLSDPCDGCVCFLSGNDCWWSVYWGNIYCIDAADFPVEVNIRHLNKHVKEQDSLSPQSGALHDKENMTWVMSHYKMHAGSFTHNRCMGSLLHAFP